jgi:hypothetical protein
MPKYKVPCWNCDGEGNIEPVFDEWDSGICGYCKGMGFLVVSELTDDNCEDAIAIKDDFPA